MRIRFKERRDGREGDFDSLGRERCVGSIIDNVLGKLHCGVGDICRLREKGLTGATDAVAARLAWVHLPGRLGGAPSWNWMRMAAFHRAVEVTDVVFACTQLEMYKLCWERSLTITARSDVLEFVRFTVLLFYYLP